MFKSFWMHLSKSNAKKQQAFLKAKTKGLVKQTKKVRTKIYHKFPKGTAVFYILQIIIQKREMMTKKIIK